MVGDARRQRRRGRSGLNRLRGWYGFGLIREMGISIALAWAPPRCGMSAPEPASETLRSLRRSGRSIVDRSLAVA